MAGNRELACRCGKVHLHVRNAPLISAECHCDSCRAAGTRLVAAGVSPSPLNDDGGTAFVLYRKDRVEFIRGTEHLRAFRLTPDSTTLRVMAACCHTPIYLEFKGGHWLSLYAGLWPDADRPQMQLRTMLGDRKDGKVFSDDIATGRWATVKFYALLLGAWAAMGFRAPVAPTGGGQFDA
jgi:hypothetical protein